MSSGEHRQERAGVIYLLNPRRYHPRAVIGPTSQMRKRRPGRQSGLESSPVWLHGPSFQSPASLTSWGSCLHRDAHFACHGGLSDQTLPSGSSQSLSSCCFLASLHSFVHSHTHSPVLDTVPIAQDSARNRQTLPVNIRDLAGIRVQRERGAKRRESLKGRLGQEAETQ